MRFTRLHRLSSAVLSALLMGFGASAASATVILLVDVSNIEAVKFIPTGESADADSTSFPMNQGVTLFSFLQTFDGGGSTMSGNLKPPGTVFRYDRADVLSDEFGNATPNLTLTAPNLELQQFSTATAAFTGIGIADLSQYKADLPFAGSTGDIVPGNLTEGIGNVTLGQYEVVALAEIPLPPSMLLFASVLGGLAIGRLKTDHRG